MDQKLHEREFPKKAGSQNSDLELVMYHNAVLACRALQLCIRQLTLGRLLIWEAWPFAVLESRLRPPRSA